MILDMPMRTRQNVEIVRGFPCEHMVLSGLLLSSVHGLDTKCITCIMTYAILGNFSIVLVTFLSVCAPPLYPQHIFSWDITGLVANYGISNTIDSMTMCL